MQNVTPENFILMYEMICGFRKIRQRFGFALLEGYETKARKSEVRPRIRPLTNKT